MVKSSLWVAKLCFIMFCGSPSTKGWEPLVKSIIRIMLSRNADYLLSLSLVLPYPLKLSVFLSSKCLPLQSINCWILLSGEGKTQWHVRPGGDFKDEEEVSKHQGHNLLVNAASRVWEVCINKHVINNSIFSYTLSNGKECLEKDTSHSNNYI